jgi:hypothetical protein
MANERDVQLPSGREAGRAVIGPRAMASPAQPTNLADLLERVLDKGIVIAGDITVSLGQIELLTIKIRLLIASVERAQEMGINWWTADPALTTGARSSDADRARLVERIERLEARLSARSLPTQNGTGTSGTTPKRARRAKSASGGKSRAKRKS